MVARRLLAVATALLVAYADDVAQQQQEDFQAMKCSACCSIVAELERNLETEKPRMNVDLRNTLSGGKQGKVVDYAVSELRTLEVLEAVCPAMTHYGVTRMADGKGYYQRHSVAAGSVHIAGSMTIGGDHYTWDKRALRSYCDGLLEAHEDTLGEAIRSAGLANVRRREEARRAADADAAGEAPADHRAVLGVAPDAAVDEIKRAYRRLSRELHPDRTGGDPGALRDFVRVAAAHEALTGEAHRPYDDLYSDVCLRIAGVCDDDADVDAAKEFFPRYDGSSKFPPTKKNTGPDHYDELTGKKKKRRRKKAAKKEL